MEATGSYGGANKATSAVWHQESTLHHGKGELETQSSFTARDRFLLLQPRTFCQKARLAFETISVSHNTSSADKARRDRMRGKNLFSFTNPLQRELKGGEEWGEDRPRKHDQKPERETGRKEVRRQTCSFETLEEAKRSHGVRSDKCLLQMRIFGAQTERVLAAALYAQVTMSSGGMQVQGQHRAPRMTMWERKGMAGSEPIRRRDCQSQARTLIKTNFKVYKKMDICSCFPDWKKRVTPPTYREHPKCCLLSIALSGTGSTIPFSYRR